ncbi:flagellar basal body P-ring formation chaperone FlgA [Psychromonas sp.]|nr:flagellar basal body P-ring formation chaperone FlgA [Psychromonas sp.]
MIRFILFVLSLGTSYSFADSNYSKEIEKFAEALVFEKYEETFELTGEQKLSIKAKPISSFLSFKECSQPLQGEIVGDKIKSKTSVKVTCNGNEQWDIYIRVQVQTLVPLIVASRSLSKGEILGTNNMELIYKAESQVRGSVFTSTDILTGARLKKNVSSERSIRHRDICYVCKDDKVTITANKNGLVIKASGIALSDGIIGETVQVMNSRTERIVVGTVYALKEVHVTF